METKDRDKIRAAAENVLSAGKMNVMVLPCKDIIALLDALDEEYITSLQAENTRLRELLGEVLPHVECVNPIQSQLITEIGEYLEALTLKGGE